MGDMGDNEKCMLIKIKQETIREQGSIYEAVRQWWTADIDKARRADLVLAILVGSGGKVIGVYKPSKWYEATNGYVRWQTSHKRPVSKRKRIAFEGKEITNDVKYLGKKLSNIFQGINPRLRTPFCYTYD
jgi:hypothetical protein